VNAGGTATNQGMQKPATVVDSVEHGRAAGDANRPAGVRAGSPSDRRKPTASITERVNQPADTSTSRSVREETASPVGGISSTVVAGTVVGGVEPAAEEQPVLGIHPGFLPDAGKCRIWVPNLPYGRQARERSCNGITDDAPAGAWILRRSREQPDVVNVDYVDEESAGVIVRTRAFNARSGSELRRKR
jgi:hypothetical protein